MPKLLCGLKIPRGAVWHAASSGSERMPVFSALPLPLACFSLVEVEQISRKLQPLAGVYGNAVTSMPLNRQNGFSMHPLVHSGGPDALLTATSPATADVSSSCACRWTWSHPG